MQIDSNKKDKFTSPTRESAGGLYVDTLQRERGRGVPTAALSREKRKDTVARETY